MLNAIKREEIGYRRCKESMEEAADSSTTMTSPDPNFTQFEDVALDIREAAVTVEGLLCLL